MRFALRFITIVSLAGTFILSGNQAAGQTQPDTAIYYLGPVITLGTRMAEPWLKVPLSLSVVLRQDLPKGKGYGLDEALSSVPGVLVQSRTGNQDVRLTIRGFGARGAGERSNAGTSRGVRILNNGFPETEPDGRTSFDLIDISGAGSIEIMRSNASSLYGNASGGVVNILSNTTFESPYVQYTEAAGSYGFRKEAVHAGANLGAGKLYLSLSNRNFDGWRTQSRSTQALLNTGIVTPIGDKTSLGIHIAGTSNLFRVPGPLSQKQFDSLPGQSDSNYIKRDERRFNRLGRIGVNVSHAFDENNSLTVSAFTQPKFIQRSERGTFRDFTRYHVGGNAMYGNTTALSSTIKNKAFVGVDEAYQDGAILFYTLSAAGGRALPLRDNKREGANNLGAYVQDEVSIGEDVVILGGLRYDNISYYSDSYINLKLSSSKAFEQVTPKLGITWCLSPTHSIYAAFGGGVEAPAGNETDPIGTYGQDTVYNINPLLEPIRSKTFEVGTKHILKFGSGEASVQCMYDVAAYWIQVNNDIVPYRNGRFYFTAGKTERMGVEAGGSIRFGMGLSANLALTVSKNEYKEYTVDSAHYGNPGKIADYAGNKAVGIPDIFYSAGVKYMPDFLKGVFVSANIRNVGEYFADDANTVTVPSYTVFNAGVGLEHLNFAGGRLYVSAFAGVDNLTDAKNIGSAWLNPDIVKGAPVFIEPGLPRNFIGSLTLGVNM